MDSNAVQTVVGWLNDPIIRLKGWNLTAPSLIKLIAYPALAILFARWMRRLIIRLLKQQGHLDPSVQVSIATVVYYAVLAMGLLMAVSATGLPMQSLAVFSGAIGLGVGLGMQDIARNFASGLIMLLGRPIRPTDWIALGDLEGGVVSIGIYSTIIRTLDDANVVVPNSQLLNSQIINWTLDRQIRRIKVGVGVGYGSDMQLVTRLLMAVAAASTDVLKEPAPYVQLTGFGASSVSFDLVVWTSSRLTNPIQLMSDLYYAIWETCQQNKIELPFTQLDLHLRDGASLLTSPRPAAPPGEQAAGPDKT
jgi:small-conductance mechanosensitive channel